MKKLNENAKVTLSIGQLKRLIRESIVTEGKHWPEDYKKTAFNTIKNSDLGKTSWYSDEYINQDLDNIIKDFEPLSHKNSNLGFFATIIRWFIDYSGSDKNRYQEFLERKLDNIIQGLLKLTAMPDMMKNAQEIKSWSLDKFESWKKSEDEKSDNQKLDGNFRETGDYDIIPCYSYDELHEKFGGDRTGYYGESEWCHANGKSTYDDWTKDKTRMFFVIAKKGWKNIDPLDPDTTNAYDEYGLSLIAILVDLTNGKLLNTTLRWNHIIDPSKTKPGATVDKAFDNYVELSKAVGVNVEEKIRPIVQRNKIELFEIDENHVLIKYRGSDTNVVIPNGVKSIGNWAFYRCSGLTSVTIPPSVTSIGDEAFHDCFSLESITIPSSVTSIGKGAFNRCINLTSVTIPSSVTKIENWAFAICGLTSMTIPKGVTSIGEWAFYDCYKLTSVTIPDSVTSIGKGAFYDCENLSKLKAPWSLIKENPEVFKDCPVYDKIKARLDEENASNKSN